MQSSKVIFWPPIESQNRVTPPLGGGGDVTFALHRARKRTSWVHDDILTKNPLETRKPVFSREFLVLRSCFLAHQRGFAGRPAPRASSCYRERPTKAMNIADPILCSGKIDAIDGHFIKLCDQI